MNCNDKNRYGIQTWYTVINYSKYGGLTLYNVLRSAVVINLLIIYYKNNSKEELKLLSNINGKETMYTITSKNKCVFQTLNILLALLQ